MIGTIETLQDFTIRHQTETVLKKSEAHYRHLSITDNLTGLFNSRHFYKRSERDRPRIRYSHRSPDDARRGQLQKYNDTYGHLEGDEVLKQLAEVIRNCLRLGDNGYRIGGEEFAVIMPDTDVESAKLVAERLRATFATARLKPRPDLTTYCTTSIGVTHYRPYEKLTAFIRRGDAAVTAKHQGKNASWFPESQCRPKHAASASL